MKDFNYRKKSDRFLIGGIVAKLLLPCTGIGDALLVLGVGNAAADIYWHPANYSEIIENVWPMPYEEMTEKEINDWRDHQDKTDVKKEEKAETERKENKNEKQ